MSVYIPDMEFPKKCANCQFREYWEGNPWTYGYRCWILGKSIDKNIENETKHADCKLKEGPNA